MLLTELFSSEKLIQLQYLVKSRSKHSIADFTEQERKIISKDILTIVKKYPKIKKIWITGSYVHGGHVLPNEDEPYLKLREYFKLNTNLSDRDYKTKPVIVNKIGNIDIVNITKNKEILVFDSGLNLFEEK